MTNHYETLGIDRFETAGAIELAYRRLAMRHHPDRGGDEEKFKAVQEAGAVLRDPSKKHVYDSSLATGQPNASGKIEVVSQADIDKALSQPYLPETECVICDGSGSVRVGQKGFWTTRACPNCARKT